MLTACFATLFAAQLQRIAIVGVGLTTCEHLVVVAVDWRDMQHNVCLMGDDNCLLVLHGRPWRQAARRSKLANRSTVAETLGLFQNYLLTVRRQLIHDGVLLLGRH